MCDTAAAGIEGAFALRQARLLECFILKDVRQWLSALERNRVTIKSGDVKFQFIKSHAQVFDSLSDSIELKNFSEFNERI